MSDEARIGCGCEWPAVCTEEGDPPSYICPGHQRMIAAAREEGRRRGLEEAAMDCHSQRGRFIDKNEVRRTFGDNPLIYSAFAYAESRIRALLERGGGVMNTAIDLLAEQLAERNKRILSLEGRLASSRNRLSTIYHVAGIALEGDGKAEATAASYRAALLRISGVAQND